MSNSAELYDKKKVASAEEKLFGPPFAYYKDRKTTVSTKLIVAGAIFTLVVIIDFLLATNIVIYVRTIDPSDNSEIFSHTFIIILSFLALWSTYRFCIWYVKKFKVLDSIKSNKLYKRIANEVIELDHLLGNDEADKND